MSPFCPRLKKKLWSITRSIFLLVGTPSAPRPELASRGAEHSLLWRMSFYIFDILFVSPNMLCVMIFMASLFWLAVGPWSL